MANHLYVLDFDRTIFNAAFYDLLPNLLTERGPLDETMRAGIATAIADPAPSTDLAGLLSRFGVDVEKVLDELQSQLDPAALLYPDVPAFLERHRADTILIATTGARQWQTMKLNLCSLLEPYPQLILGENKGAYLRDQLVHDARGLGLPEQFGPHRFAKLTLADDRIDNLQPLLGQPQVELWHIQRPDAKYPHQRNHPGIRRLASLDATETEDQP